MGRIRVLLADDDERYLSTLGAFLRAHQDLEVVGSAPDGVEAVRAYGELWPDVVVMDVSMPGLDGVESTRVLTGRYPNARVLMLTAYDDAEIRRRSLAAGAAGFVNKSDAARDLVPEIRKAAHVRRDAAEEPHESTGGGTPETSNVEEPDQGGGRMDGG